MNNDLQTIQKLKQLGICVVIPTYNNAQFLPSVLKSVLCYCSDVIVVNDGSPDNTDEVLRCFSDKITIVSQPKNLGKGKALKAGFEKALQLGFKYVVTMDSDGQHKAEDLWKFAQEIEKNPDALVIGARTLEGKDIKSSSSFANKFSNFWFAIHTLHRLSDTQTGYRLYPVYKMGNMKIFTSRYETELEILVRCAWRGIPIKPVSINVFYPSKEQRVSGFRPFKDFTRISILNTFFTFAAIFYGYPSMLIRWLIRKC